MKHRYIYPASVLLLLTTLPITGAVQKSDLDVKKISRTVAYSLPIFHINQLPLDDHIATNAFNLFIDSLDPAHSFFLQSDIDAFKKELPTLDNRLKKGDISFAETVYSTLLERMSNRVDYVDTLLKKGFNTSIKETFMWDRKDAPWPKDEIEWNELWRKRIKNEYIAQLVAKTVFSDEKTQKGTAKTNTTGQIESEYDEETEKALLSPEEFIRERYKQFLLTMESFDEEMLLQRYLSSFTQAYDPHSDYMSPSSVEDFNINMKLSLVGIGALLRSEDGMAKIVRIIPGGPADKDGRLKPGDKIIAVAQGDEEPVSILHWPLYKTVRLIRGKKDTKVVLTIIPASDRTGTRTKKIALIRDEVKLEEQAAKSKVKEIKLSDGRIKKIGIIDLPDFYADFKAAQRNDKNARRASSDVKRLIRGLKKEGIEGMILDLRNNGGGSLIEAIETAGLFITSGPIVQVKEKNGIQVLPDADPEIEYDGPLVVLVNRLSASASEILAAALQDYDRAVIVGSKTHGKGTVQTLMPLGSESSRRGSLKLTTATFYRINGSSTQLKGVTPDIILPSYLDVMDLGEDSLKHALPWNKIWPALYRPAGNLSDIIPELKKRSALRIKNDPEFTAYMEKRERLKKRYETKTVSLCLEDRIAEAQAEKELDEIQNNIVMGDDEKENTRDIILDETIHILSDLIEIKNSSLSGELVQTAA